MRESYTTQGFNKNVEDYWARLKKPLFYVSVRGRHKADAANQHTTYYSW